MLTGRVSMPIGETITVMTTLHFCAVFPRVMEHPDAWSFQLTQIAERYGRVGTPRIRMLPHSFKYAERLTQMHQCITGDQNTKLEAHFLGLCFLKFGLDCRGQNGSGMFRRFSLPGKTAGLCRFQLWANCNCKFQDAPSLFQNGRRVEEDPWFYKA